MEPRSSSDEIVAGETEGGTGDSSFNNSFDGLFDGGELPEENDGGENVLSFNSSARQPEGSWAVLKHLSRLPKVVEVGDGGLEMRHDASNDNNKVKTKQRKPVEQESETEDENEDALLERNNGKVSFCSLFQLFGFILIVCSLVCTLTISLLKKKNLCGLNLWKWEILGLAVVSGRVGSRWLIRLAICFLERKFVSRTWIVYFVSGARKNFQNLFWIGLVLIAWESLFAKNVGFCRKGFALISTVLECIFVGMVLWVVKIVVVKTIGSWYHIGAYFDQIQEAVFHQYLIVALSGPTLINNLPKSRKLLFISKLNPKNISFWKMKRLIKMIRYGFLHDQIMEAPVEYDSKGYSRREKEAKIAAKIAAKKIFQNVAKSHEMFITLDDLRRFLPNDEALKTINLVEGSPDIGKISEGSLKKWVVDAYLERLALASRLRDAKTVMSSLRRMMDVLFVTLIFFCCLDMSGIASSHFAFFMCFQLISQTFLFGETLKLVLQAMIFIFVFHPYDVGDLCEIDKEKLIVEEVNILTTSFISLDRQWKQYHHEVLATKSIVRFSNREDIVDFIIKNETSLKQINKLKDKITSYIQDVNHWYPSIKFVERHYNGSKKTKMSLFIKHRMMMQENMANKWYHRAELIEEITRTLKVLGIDYCFLFSYDASVSDKVE